MCACENNCPDCNNGEVVKSPERRRFLGLAVGVINAVVGIAVVGPVIGFIGAPLFKRVKGRWISVAKVEDVGEGQTKEVAFRLKVKDGYKDVERTYTVYLSQQQGAFVAFDPSCTHLGCRVKFQADKHKFFCPCHGGVFETDGTVVSGPPPKPLNRYETKVQDGQVWLYREV
jgi:menaquinol-cytochrome c reductase iron-sulfur subunit